MLPDFDGEFFQQVVHRRSMRAHERHVVRRGPARHHSGQFARTADQLTGVVKDLKLPPKKHELARGIVSRHTLPRNVNEATSSPLFGEMRAVLDDQEYEDFVAATARLSRRPITFIR